MSVGQADLITHLGLGPNDGGNVYKIFLSCYQTPLPLLGIIMYLERVIHPFSNMVPDFLPDNNSFQADRIKDNLKYFLVAQN